MKIDRNDPHITIQYWELGPRLSHIATRQSPMSARCMDEITITRVNNTTAVSGDLTVPVGWNPTVPLERNLLIPRQKLQ
jgi:hypothetical protein